MSGRRRLRDSPELSPPIVARRTPSFLICLSNRPGVTLLQIFVRDNNIDQALRMLKRKMQREGVFREMKRRRFYEKPSEKVTREKGEAIRRRRKLLRKEAIREGLIAAPKKQQEKFGNLQRATGGARSGGPR